MKKKKTQKPHYGKLLKKHIEKEGLKKIKVAERLGVSRVWLDELLSTGKFTPERLTIVKEILK